MSDKPTMKLFPRDRSHPDAPNPERWSALQQEVAALRQEAEGLRELLRHVDADRALLVAAATRLRPGLPHRELGEAMFELVFRPFDLASFYVAEVDWPEDLLAFAYYHEGGRARNHPSRRLSQNPGLTGRTLLQGHPVYTRTLEEAQAMGALFTEAEKGTGLIPASWYGVPLGCSGRPQGLVSFQSFQRDAFPEARREILDALSAILGMAMFGGQGLSR